MKVSGRLLSKTKYKGPKLRGIHWATVDEKKTKGTIWEGRKRTFSTVSHMFQDVEDVFAPGSIKKTESFKKEKKKKNSVISLLTPKRTQNIAIALARVWSGPFSELARAITMLKCDVIGIDNVEKLIKISPTAAEVNLVKSYTGDIALLNKADRFILTMGSVNRLQARLNAMIFHEKFKETISSVVEAIELIKCASNEILESHNFQELLGIVLSLGNKLNQNTRKQLAAGIRLDSLMKLAATKGKTGVTVLEYMVQHLLSSKAELLELGQELKHLKAATFPNYSNILVDMKMLQRGLDDIQKQILIEKQEGETIFESEYGNFCRNANSKIQSANIIFKEMKEQYAKAAQWLFEDPKKVEPANLFSKILLFISTVDRTKVKVEEKRRRTNKGMKATGTDSKKSIKSLSNDSKRLLDSASKLEMLKKSRRHSVDAWKDEPDSPNI